jgi:hypothetical protein
MNATNGAGSGTKENGVKSALLQWHRGGLVGKFFGETLL